MQPRSAVFDATVARSHQLVVRADIVRTGKTVAQGLPVTAGSVTANRTQLARRTAAVTIGDPAYTPTGAAGDLLAPYGNEIRLWRGAVTVNGPELICVGTFGIRSVTFDDGVFKGIAVTGIDRLKRVEETRFPFPRTSPPAASAVEQIKALLREVVPWAEVRVDPDVIDASLPQVTWPQSRTAALIDLVSSLGCEVFADPYGDFILQPQPSPNDPPVFTVTGGPAGVLIGHLPRPTIPQTIPYTIGTPGPPIIQDGAPGGVLIAARHDLTRDQVYNGIVARGSTTTAGGATIISDLITDDDPTSPTFWGGPFGQVVGFYDSGLFADKDQANSAARAILVNNTGAARSINYSTLVNPALEPGDVVQVIHPDTGVVERHLQDSITIPLDAAGVMTAQTRSTLSQVKYVRRQRQHLYGGNLS